MCSYLFDKADPETPVTILQLGLGDVDVWLNLCDGSKRGKAQLGADDLRIVDMDYSGEASEGYLSTWGQTGCTVIMAIQVVGRQGSWAYFNHVNSSMIDQGVQHACDAVSQLPGCDGIVFVIMGGPGGKNTYESLLRRIRPQGADWRFAVLVKPENRMEESVLCIPTCSLALTADLVGKAANDRKQLSGFQPVRVPFKPPKAAPQVTGHRELDAQLKSKKLVNVWINLSVECEAPPDGMPDDPFNGPVWLMQKANLQALLTALSKQNGFRGLNPIAAMEPLHKHLGTLKK